MDIPNTGAIFTLGKSHLAENTQSYFYIKNDPVRKLTSGANQSAVICESGRLFVWGENHFGQLGVGASSSGHNDIVTKPTCVKSLKTLGLKIADMAFGNGWSVILTYSNEIFFTGRNIFAADVKVSENFINTTAHGEKCSIIRKPFRLEQFDDCLSASEDQENFIGISSGNGHFALLTSLGRLIGWGSNEHHQLGSDENELNEPYEIVLDSKIKQFVCGPTSTLILTENENLYLTGRLKEFVFPQFTELQKNLSAQEKILFMHISQASEIYIVTNEGGIYHSIESKRNNSLIFQRFYDYDSEENGQIVKLLRGTSFYAALTKANKFFTTFSESGHHLKTFREISKFKNLRTLDVVVGDQHILVHGIPRSANKLLNKTFVVRPDSNANIKQVPLQSSIVEGNIPEEAEEMEDGNNNESVKPNTPTHVENADGLVEVPSTEIERETNSPENEKESSPVRSPPKQLETLQELSPTASVKSIKSIKSDEYRKLEESEMESNNSTPSKKTILTAKGDSTSSPSLSVRSRKGSARSIRFDEKSLVKQNSTERIVRPRTPYPDDAPTKAINNLGDDEEEQLDKTSPAFNDSLENIPETVATFKSAERDGSSKSKASPKKRKLTPLHRDTVPAIPNEEDEELAVEISSTDFLDKTVVNEIRFINNGIDVTDNVSKKHLPKIDSVSSTLEEEAATDIEDVEETIKKTADSVKNTATSVVDTAADKISTEADKAVETTKEKAESISTEASSAFGAVSSKVNAAVAKVSSEVDNVAGKVSNTFDTAITSISEGVDNTMSSMSNTMSTTVNKLSTKVDDAKHNISNLLSGGGKDETPSNTDASTPKDSSKIDDDERTTASVNSTGTGNPFETDNDHEQVFEPVKHSLADDIRETGETGRNKVKQFFTDMKAKGKGISCRDDRAIRIEDEPPKYTPVDEYADQPNRTSKVCVIL